MDALSVSIDTAQTRIKKDRVATLIYGEDWSRRYSSNCYIEPVTFSAILRPYCYTPEWRTTGTGNYKRYTVADYNLTASKWVDDPVTTVDNYIKGTASDGNNSEVVTTKATQPANGAMYLSWFAANAGADDMVAIECGWGSPSTAPISLRFYAGGKVEIYRNLVFEADYTINGAQHDQNAQQTANQFVTVTIHPFRRRELLIVSNRGGGCVHLFDDIDSLASDPIITPNLPFWWTVPQGMAKVSCAPCLFNTSGYVTGIKTYFATPPDPTAPFGQITYYDANAGGASSVLVQPDNPTAIFTANNTDTVCRVRVDLSGNGIRTPNVYGAYCAYETITAQTPSEPVVLDDWLVKASLEVPDNASDLRWTIELTNPDELETAGATGISYIANRPISFNLGPTVITKGVTSSVKLKIGIDDTTSRVTIEARDKFKLCEHYLFTDQTPLDGLNIIDAFRLVLNTAGIPDSLLDLEPTTFTLPKSDTPTKGDFAVLINPGDSAADWLNRLHENYCATWYMGWNPTPDGWRFTLASPTTLGTTSSYTLYETIEDALAADVDRSQIIQHIYRSYNDQPLEPEANDIWVIGRDLRTGKPLIGHKADTASQDPTTVKASRPRNWLGEVRKYGIYDGTITSQDAIERAVGILFDRLTPLRVVAEFVCDFLVKDDGIPIWRGDVVTLDGLGDYRIKSLSTEFIREPDSSSSTVFWRPTRYVAELIQDGINGMTSFSGYSLSQVTEAHRRRSISKSVVRNDAISQGLVNQKPLEVFVY